MVAGCKHSFCYEFCLNEKTWTCETAVPGAETPELSEEVETDSAQKALCAMFQLEGCVTDMKMCDPHDPGLLDWLKTRQYGANGEDPIVPVKACKHDFDDHALVKAHCDDCQGTGPVVVSVNIHTKPNVCIPFANILLILSGFERFTMRPYIYTRTR